MILIDSTPNPRNLERGLHDGLSNASSRYQIHMVRRNEGVTFEKNFLQVVGDAYK
jgi:hypothetical protein